MKSDRWKSSEQRRDNCARTREGRKESEGLFRSKYDKKKLKEEGGAEPQKEENLNRKQRWIKGIPQPCDGGFFFFFFFFFVCVFGLSLCKIISICYFLIMVLSHSFEVERFK